MLRILCLFSTALKQLSFHSFILSKHTEPSSCSQVLNFKSTQNMVYICLLMHLKRQHTTTKSSPEHPPPMKCIYTLLKRKVSWHCSSSTCIDQRWVNRALTMPPSVHKGFAELNTSHTPNKQLKSFLALLELYSHWQQTGVEGSNHASLLSPHNSMKIGERRWFARQQ